MKALVLSSGGIDSTTCIGIAIDQLGKENVSTVSFYYGQKHDKELKCAKEIAEHYGIPHYELNIEEIFKNSNCSLLKGSTKEISHKSYAEQIEQDGEVETYVPFRNGLLLASATSLAMSIYSKEDIEIYLGVHADDSAGSAYADCSEEFTQTINKAINIGTYERVKLVAPLVNMNKGEVVKTGLQLDVPYDLTWSCYEGKEKQCGICGTCIDRKQAFEINGTKDPVAYMN